jgi:hypothetical protein
MCISGASTSCIRGRLARRASTTAIAEASARSLTLKKIARLPFTSAYPVAMSVFVG